MKKLVLPAFLFITTLGFSQIDMGSKSKPESNTQGIFVKGGSMKLTSLDCYTFKDMAIAFDIDPAFFNYDVIEIWLSRGTVESERPFRFLFTKEEFARKFKGKKYAFLDLFPKEGMSESSVMGFSRMYLQYSDNKKDAVNSKLYVTINGGIKNGRQEYYDQNSMKTVSRDTYSYDRLADLTPLPLNNMIAPKAFSSYPSKPKDTGDCYN